LKTLIRQYKSENSNEDIVEKTLINRGFVFCVEYLSIRSVGYQRFACLSSPIRQPIRNKDGNRHNNHHSMGDNPHNNHPNHIFYRPTIGLLLELRHSLVMLLPNTTIIFCSFWRRKLWISFDPLLDFISFLFNLRKSSNFNSLFIFNFSSKLWSRINHFSFILSNQMLVQFILNWIGKTVFAFEFTIKQVLFVYFISFKKKNDFFNFYFNKLCIINFKHIWVDSQQQEIIFYLSYLSSVNPKLKVDSIWLTKY